MDKVDYLPINGLNETIIKEAKDWLYTTILASASGATSAIYTVSDPELFLLDSITAIINTTSMGGFWFDASNADGSSKIRGSAPLFVWNSSTKRGTYQFTHPILMKENDVLRVYANVATTINLYASIRY